MSLIRQRRERREVGARLKTGMSLFRLVALLILVIGIIWWLGRLY